MIDDSFIRATAATASARIIWFLRASMCICMYITSTAAAYARRGFRNRLYARARATAFVSFMRNESADSPSRGSLILFRSERSRFLFVCLRELLFFTHSLFSFRRFSASRKRDRPRTLILFACDVVT